VLHGNDKSVLASTDPFTLLGKRKGGLCRGPGSTLQSPIGSIALAVSLAAIPTPTRWMDASIAMAADHLAVPERMVVRGAHDVIHDAMCWQRASVLFCCRCET
jgi:hypothetical protein